MVSPFFKLRKGVSKIISSVEEFSSLIIILLFDDWIDSIVPVYVFVVWDRSIIRRMPRREAMNIVFRKFITRGVCGFLNMCRFGYCGWMFCVLYRVFLLGERFLK